MAKEMEECSDGIRQATADVTEGIDKLADDHRNQDAKQQILDAGKAIMKFMVRLLQLNDLYEVNLLLKQVRFLRTTPQKWHILLLLATDSSPSPTDQRAR